MCLLKKMLRNIFEAITKTIIERIIKDTNFNDLSR